MEKIRLKDTELEIINIKQLSDTLLEIEFSKVINLTSYDLSEIEILTNGDLVCNTFTGYTTIYKIDGNVVTLSADESVYIEPIEIEIVDIIDNAKAIMINAQPTELEILQENQELMQKALDDLIFGGAL